MTVIAILILISKVKMNYQLKDKKGNKGQKKH